MQMNLQTDDQILTHTSDDFNDPPTINLTWTEYIMENMDNQDPNHGEPRKQHEI
jgi:hypothetical protein